MRVNLKLAADIHDWLMVEGRKCYSGEDLESAINRFLRRWPRVKADVLQYVSGMLSAQLHVKTIKPAAILKGVRERITAAPAPRRPWWHIR
jgi:hypothetical protein